jgi:hypothetical protein
LSKESKLAKKEAKAAKKAVKAEKAAQKAAAKAEKKHAKDYDKFVKKTTKENEKGAKKAASKGVEFTAAAIPAIDEFKSKSELKAIKANDKAYAAYVKKINKKNAKLEKKAAKKGTPFVPLAIPEKDEVVLAENKKKKIIKMIILILLIWLFVYFIIMWFRYVPVIKPANDDTSVSDEAKVYDYEPYSNPHEITTTPDYSISDAKRFLQQVIHDNYKTIGYSSDVSNSAITYNNKLVNVNNAECYVFSCSGKTFAVSVKLSACYVYENGKYEPLTFNDTNIIF